MFLSEFWGGLLQRGRCLSHGSALPRRRVQFVARQFAKSAAGVRLKVPVVRVSKGNSRSSAPIYAGVYLLMILVKTSSAEFYVSQLDQKLLTVEDTEIVRGAI